MSTPYAIHQFTNGVRLVHKQTDSPVSHFGVLINVGSRDEHSSEQGMAHFVEHMLFKGTRGRTSGQVINCLENVGADLNAFTNKEDTCVFASFLARHTGKAVELLSDIVFNSIFPGDELIRERNVILDEINSYKESPAEWIHDEFDELVFPGHSLGKNILGIPSCLKKFNRERLLAFVGKHYVPGRIVLSSVGSMPFKRMVALTEKHFGGKPGRDSEIRRQTPESYEPKHIQKRFSRHQAHLIMGNRAYSFHDERRVHMALLNNILGGPAMNSRLNMELREKNGIAYNLESNYQAFSDTGLFSIYVGTDEKLVDKALDIVYRELNRLRKNALGNRRLHTAKEQFKGQLAISMETGQHEMLAIGKGLMIHNKVETFDEICCRIDRVSSHSLLDISNEIFDPSGLSLLVFNRQ